MVGFGIIGYGYWGPNVVRNLQKLDRSRVVAICDGSEKARRRAAQENPGVRLLADPAELMALPEVDVVAVITPVWTHFELTQAALEAGKHVFVEKPFTSTVAQGERLIELAARKRLRIMVDHTFLFTGAVRKIQELMRDGTLGRLFYYDSTRVNLGLFQHDVNVLWDLAPHDLSIMANLIGARPQAVVATGERHLNGHADVAYLTAYYPENVIAHINVNWLSPVKVRTTLIGGEKKMVVWNDLEADEKVKVYDKGVDVGNREGIYDLLVSYRSGDMWAPRVEPGEALTTELNYFLDCLERDEAPHNGGEAGLEVVRMLEAADQSLRQRGHLVEL
ncbi:MAG: Gfo/Idh/MocA family protein [Terriglobales bacterium]